MAEKKFSTAFSQDAEVGVKWNRLVFELTMTTGPGSRKAHVSDREVR